jgi:quinol-cytochrome oxidoreductase complex cytochrome b subunit
MSRFEDLMTLCYNLRVSIQQCWGEKFFRGNSMFRREEPRRSRLSAKIVSFLGDLSSAQGRARIAQRTSQTVWSVADQATRAITAGLSLDDVRALWRGEQDPAVYARVSSRAFWTHFRPQAYLQSSIKVSHTFGFGFFSVLFAFVQLVTGTLMMFFYEPSPARAYASVVKLVTQVPLGQWLRDVHHLCAQLLVLFVLLHLLRVYFTGAFKQLRRFTWVTGVLLLVLVWLIALIGTRLPMDQTVGWGNPNDVLLYYLLHTGILPGAGLLLVAVHYYRVARLHGISLPAGEEESPDATVREKAHRRISYFPDVWAREVMWIAFALCVVLTLAAFVLHAPLAPPFDAEHLQNIVPWFVLWWRGLVNTPILLPILVGLRDGFGIDLTPSYDPMFWQGYVMPILFVVLLLAVPYLDAWWDKMWNRTPSRLGGNRKLSIALGLLALAGLIVFSYLGTLSSLEPAAAFAQEFLPDVCTPSFFPLFPPDCGEVRRIGYDGLPAGTFEFARYAAPSADRFENLLSKMYVRLQMYPDLADAQGALIVEEWQTHLKKITLRIRWTPRAPSESGTFEKTIYLHRDSMYE